MKIIRYSIVATMLCYLIVLTMSWAFFYLTSQRGGILGLVQVFAPHLFLPVLVLLPIACLASTDRVRTIVLLYTVLYGCRFLPGLVSLPRWETPGVENITIMTWNVLWWNKNTDGIVHSIRDSNADVVALQELTVAQRQALENSPVLRQRYPYRQQIDAYRADGIGLLSAYPIIDSGKQETPPIIWARLDVGEGRSIVVVTAHPVLFDPRLRHFEPIYRDMQFGIVRKTIEPFLQGREPLILAGDFNVTEREPGYQELSAGLVDAHYITGFGFGNTWRSEEFRPAPFGVLRIDYLFSSPGVRPLSSNVDCSQHDSDHCRVTGTFELVHSTTERN